MDLVDDNFDVDEVDEVLEDQEVMDLEEAEDLVRQRAEEARLWARACYPILGIKVSATRSVQSGSTLGGAGVSAGTEGISPRLLQLLMEQQNLLQDVEGRGGNPAPSPKFQLFNRGEKAAVKPPNVINNSGFLLRAQLGQLYRRFKPGRILPRVNMLQDSQQQMHEHQVQVLRRHQTEAAEKKVDSVDQVC